MKKWVVLLILAAFWGCSKEESFDLQEKNSKVKFELNVPSDFTWSAVLQDVVLVNFTSGGEKTNVLDGTLVELYSTENELLDALIVQKGNACFNIRVPAETEKLKFKIAATGAEVEFSPKKRSLDYEIPDISNIKTARSDRDKDGMSDQFDAAPNDPELSVSLGKAKQRDTWKSYYLFEDLWPSKGDFDFNDIVIETAFSWNRGKDNFITEISGSCTAEWENPNFGIGFEIFEGKGSYLIYLDDIIEEAKGAQVAESMHNGFIVFADSKKSGKSTSGFTIKIKDGILRDFVCVPFIFLADSLQHQVRPFGTPPTQLQKMQLFRSGDDASPKSWEWVKGEKFKYPLEGENAFYKTRENLPWGVQFMAKEFIAPAEMQSIMMSYPKFKTWAESGGKQEKAWYNSVGGN